MLEGKKILITGVSGQVGRPIAESLALDNEVWGLARFSDPAAKADVEAHGISAYTWDMTDPAFSGLPDDFTHVLHAAMVANFMDHSAVVRPTCEATASLMSHCRNVEAFTYLSSTIVYQRLEPGHLHAETDPLGGLSTPKVLTAYATMKLSGEATVRAVSHLYGIPSTIARLNLAYGFPRSQVNMTRMIPGWVTAIKEGRPVPVQPEENFSSPLHFDDLVRQAPELWRVASLPVTIMNWGSDECIGEREMIADIAAIMGMKAKVEPSDMAPLMVGFDPTYRKSLIGPCQVSWREGAERAVNEYL